MVRAWAALITTAAIVTLTASCEERFPAQQVEPAPPAPDASGSVDAGPDATGADASGDAELDASTSDASTDASGGVCNARVAAHDIAPSPHVPDGTPIVHATNPPSSGPHYGEWANFQEFTSPVADGHLVHAMEHGAVLLLYKCGDDAGTCAVLRDEVRAVRAAVPDDPLCSAGIRTRVILAPRPSNGAVVSAAAWGHTYQADCVDPISLGAFIAAHYAQAPENFCSPGTIF